MIKYRNFNNLVYITNGCNYVEIIPIQEAIEICFDNPDYVIVLPIEYTEENKIIYDYFS